MKLTVNGQERVVAEAISVAQLLLELNLDPQRVAVEHNRAIVARDRFDSVPLNDGDQLEIVQFVGGG